MRLADRLPWLAGALLLLVAATLAGLIRIGWRIPALPTRLSFEHGPLMVAGFLGTLITLERAVALRQRAALAGVVFFALGGGLLVLGGPGVGAKIFTLLGSIGLAGIFAAILRQHRAPHTWVMAAGSLFLVGASILWLLDRAVLLIVPWWIGFLVLTIAGERLELGRILALSPASRSRFYAFCGLFAAGVLLTLWIWDGGWRVMGLGLALIAVWHFRYDIARKTVRKPGLTRFIAVCMLSGYVWLAVGGLLFLGYGLELAGPLYDAQLHAVFLGFVFAMIFGHAPIIFPAILGRQIRFHPSAYAHLALLHLSLLVRIAGDLFALPDVRRWGGMFNALALLLFLGNTLVSVLREPEP